jgi:hypothetical protein
MSSSEGICEEVIVVTWKTSPQCSVVHTAFSTSKTVPSPGFWMHWPTYRSRTELVGPDEPPEEPPEELRGLSETGKQADRPRLRRVAPMQRNVKERERWDMIFLV